MKQRLIVCLALMTGLLMGESAYAQGKPMKIRVADMFGPATYSVKGGEPKQVTVGTVLPLGTVVRTGEGAALDLHFETGEVVRLTQNTMLGIDGAVVFRKLPYIELTLGQGTILTRVKKLTGTAKVEVKVSNGVVSCREGTFRINSEGYIVALQGQVLFAYVPKQGEPVLHTLRAPPPVYFSPLEEGVRMAPPPLVKEVQNQVNANLRR